METLPNLIVVRTFYCNKMYTHYLLVYFSIQCMLHAACMDRTAECPISLGIHAAVNAISAPLAPAAFKLISRKWMLVIGGLLNSSFVLCFISPSPVLLYVFAGISGIGGSLIRIAQGTQIVVNSNKQTITRNALVV